MSGERPSNGGTLSVDPFGRVVDYLRISITDRCNERCLYCMPDGYQGWTAKEEHLTADEIIRSAAAATQLGFRKFRITGGEPLIRRDVIQILQGIWALSGTQALGISTNATRLASLARPLKQAGVRSVNISLDALDPAVYRRITGGDLRPALEGIQAAQEAGFEMIKLNCVLLRGLNEQEFLPLITFAAERRLPLRLIELMPLSQAGVMADARFLSVVEVMQRLARSGRLTPADSYRPGYGPAKYYDFEADGVREGARIGFIGALTTEHFCATCNKLRLTTDGKLRPCLGQHGEIDLRSALRAGGDGIDPLRSAIANKPASHEFLSGYAPGRPMTAIGG